MKKFRSAHRIAVASVALGAAVTACIVPSGPVSAYESPGPVATSTRPANGASIGAVTTTAPDTSVVLPRSGTPVRPGPITPSAPRAATGSKHSENPATRWFRSTYVRAPYPGLGTSPGMEAAISLTWPSHLQQQALNVAWCESSGDPRARNGQYRGHFQIGRGEWRKFGNGDPFNPIDNAAAAYRYFSAVGGSWRPWQCQP